MKKIRLLLVAFILSGFGFIDIQAQDSHTDIIPVGSSVKKLSSNQFIFTEAPVWYGDSVLLFVDDGIEPPNIFSYNPIDKQIRVFRNYSVNYNGLACDTAGNLLACESKYRRVVMMDKTAEVSKILTSGYNRGPYNGPNDLIADDKGGVYFTDPVFFGAGSMNIKGVYYIDSIGNVKRIIDELIAPNGVILSPDGKKLYVDDSNNKYLFSWDVAPDGSVSGKSNLALIKASGDSNSDGLAIDIYGNIYVSAEKGVQVFSPQGVEIATILVSGGSSNCDFGGKDFKTLYITSYKNLYSIDLNYPGYVVSRKGSSTAINSVPEKPVIQIYPNPFQDVLQIDLPGKTGMLEAFDMMGKSVLQKEIHENNASIDVSGLKTGIYFVKVRSDKQMLTRKFIKQ